MFLLIKGGVTVPRWLLYDFVWDDRLDVKDDFETSRRDTA